MKTKKKKRGGSRPGAGRKPLLEKPRRISVLLDEKQFIFCKKNNETISLYIRSLIDEKIKHQNLQIAT